MIDESSNGFICDANVLIHYYLAEKSIFALVHKRIGSIYVPRPILDDEVDQIDASEATKLGLTVFDPDDEFIIQVGSQGGGLSKHDKLLMALAQDKSYTCWTSDSFLKKQCEKNGISSLWGLEMMVLLFQKGHLTENRAISIAWKIHGIDSKYITADIVKKFERRLKEVKKTK